MSVTSVHKDPETRTMTITAEFAAPIDRVWRLWSDPRRLERWWGPPTHPATVVEHDLRPGGKVSFFMTGPDGERRDGWWHVLVVDAPRRLRFELNDPQIPTLTVLVAVEQRADGGTRMTIETHFPTDRAMEQMISMGFEQGMTAAVGQTDEILRTDADVR